jgi:hypothetical protein
MHGANLSPKLRLFALSLFAACPRKEETISWREIPISLIIEAEE